MFKVLYSSQNEEWDGIVKSFADFDIYYLNGYVKGFELHGDGRAILFYYEDDKTRAMNVSMLRDIAQLEKFHGEIDHGKYFDLSTPYGYGGWIVEGQENNIGLMNVYNKWCFSNGIISEFIRCHPLIGNERYLKEMYDIVFLGKTVSIDISSENEMWSNFTSKNRNVIRKSMKNNLKVMRSQSEEIYNDFKFIYNETMKRDEASQYYYFTDEFYNSIFNDLNDNSEIFYVENKEGKIVAASIVLYVNGRIHYHLSGSLEEFKCLAPSNLLLYKVALWGCRNGYHVFHLGGGLGAKEDSLYKFKKAFSKEEDNSFYIGKRIFNQEVYKKLVDISRNKNQDGRVNSDFFPEYRS